MLHRVWRVLASMCIGACVVLTIEAWLIYGIGVRVVVPKSQVAVLSTAVSSHLKQAWPTMQRTTLARLKPLMRHEVNRMVAEITIDVGATRVRLPTALQAEIARHIDRLLASNLDQYFQHQFNPEEIVTPQLITQALGQPLSLHMWVRAWHIPVPITIVLSGTS